MNKKILDIHIKHSIAFAMKEYELILERYINAIHYRSKMILDLEEVQLMAFSLCLAVDAIKDHECGGKKYPEQQTNIIEIVLQHTKSTNKEYLVLLICTMLLGSQITSKTLDDIKSYFPLGYNFKWIIPLLTPKENIDIILHATCNAINTESRNIVFEIGLATNILILDTFMSCKNYQEDEYLSKVEEIKKVIKETKSMINTLTRVNEEFNEKTREVKLENLTTKFYDEDFPLLYLDNYIQDLNDKMKNCISAELYLKAMNYRAMNYLNN